MPARATYDMSKALSLLGSGLQPARVTALLSADNQQRGLPPVKEATIRKLRSRRFETAPWGQLPWRLEPGHEKLYIARLIRNWVRAQRPDHGLDERDVARAESFLADLEAQGAAVAYVPALAPKPFVLIPREPRDGHYPWADLDRVEEEWARLFPGVAHGDS